MSKRKHEQQLRLAVVGEVYMADTIVFVNGDHATERPVVVVRAPRHRMDYLTVIQRTSTCFHLPGVVHDRSVALGLDRDGKWIFDYQRAVRVDEFISYSFEFLGSLEQDQIDELLAAWEAQP